MNRTASVFVSFKRADLAAAAAETIVIAATASCLHGLSAGVPASDEQVNLATRLRAKADRLFKTAMTKWAKLPPVRE